MNIFIYVMVGCIIQVYSFSRPFADNTRIKFIKDRVKIEEEIKPMSRLGRSKDEDGKSNIWSVEPKMEVVEDEEVDELNKNIVVLGLFACSVIAISPLLKLLNSVFPDPSGF